MKTHEIVASTNQGERPQTETNPANTLIWDLQDEEWREYISFIKAAQLMVLCYKSPSRLIQITTSWLCLFWCVPSPGLNRHSINIDQWVNESAESPIAALGLVSTCFFSAWLVSAAQSNPFHFWASETWLQVSIFSGWDNMLEFGVDVFVYRGRTRYGAECDIQWSLL